MDNQLKKLAAQIDKNFQAEIDSACAQLKNFNELLKQNLTNGHAEVTSKGNILSGNISPDDPYSFFEMVSWVDAEGEQRGKFCFNNSLKFLSCAQALSISA